MNGRRLSMPARRHVAMHINMQQIFYRQTAFVGKPAPTGLRGVG